MDALAEIYLASPDWLKLAWLLLFGAGPLVTSLIGLRIALDFALARTERQAELIDEAGLRRAIDRHLGQAIADRASGRLNHRLAGDAARDAATRDEAQEG